MGDLLPLVVRARFPDGALDLLLTLCPQVFAEAAPVKDRESAPEVASNPILGVLNVLFAHHTISHCLVSFGPLPEGQGHVCCSVFHLTPFLNATVSPETRRLRVTSTARSAACQRDRAQRPLGLARLQ